MLRSWQRSVLVRRPTSLLEACRQTARRTFGIKRLRPEQESAMIAVLERHDALVALPTGFGKSLIYQVPAMLFDRRRLSSRHSSR
jgi:superfamily II DNA helicase RecQ